MHGITFGRGLFETTAGRVEPDSDVHFGLLLIAAAADREGASRDEICALLWPDATPEQSRHSLRQALYRLRRLAVPIHLRGARVNLNGEGTHVDLRRLLQGSAQREELLAIGTLPFLPGYAPRLGPRFASWLEALRDRADTVRRFALVEAIREARAQARFRDIHKLARALLALDPLNETATLSLAEALVMDGSKVEALRMLDAYEEEVGHISDTLRIPVRTLRRRVSECLDDALLPRRYEVPFVGREVEFGDLRTMFVATRQGKGQCAVVTGEAGIGKTRITSELLRLAVLDGAMAVTYSCTSGDALSPLSSLLTLTQALLSQPGALGCSQEHLQYLRRLNAPESSPPIAVSGMGADIAYAQLVYSLAELVAAIADEGPLVVFVDDAQRLHQTSWRIFTDLVDRLPDRRVLLVFATRQLPEWYATLGINGSDGRSRHVRLKPFPYTESRNYLSAWSEKHGIALTEQDTHTFSLTAEGNPFYLGELAGHVARGGDARQAPASIRGLIELQYAATSKNAQRLLLVISLLQARASLTRVTEVLGSTPSDFVSALEELEIEGLVAAAGARLRVKHDLVADVTIGLATPGVVSFLRARIARILEADADETDSVELLNDSLTHWAFLSEEEHIVATALRIASRLLTAGFARDAIAAFELASRSAHESGVTLSIADGLIRATWLAGDTFGTLKRINDRDAIVRDSPHDACVEEFALIRAEASATRTQAPEPADLAGLSITGAETHPIVSRKLMIASIAADLGYRFDELRDLALRAEKFDLEGASNADLLTARLVAESSVGTLERTLHLSRKLSDLSRRSTDPRLFLLGLRRSATALAKIGYQDEAIALAEEALARAMELRLPHHQGVCLELVAYCHLEANRRAHAAAIVDRLQDLGRDQRSEMLLFFARGILLRIACETGNQSEARPLLQWLKSNTHYFTTPYSSHTLLTVAAALSSILGEPLSDDEVAELVRLHYLARTTGRQDFRTMILVRLLSERERAGEAERIIVEYLSSRKERSLQLDFLRAHLPSSIGLSL